MSEDQDESSKTEEASGRKLQKAAEEGQFAISREVNHLMAMIGVLIIVAWVAAPIVAALKNQLAYFIAESYQIPTDQAGLQIVVGQALTDAVYYSAAPLLLMMVLGVLATILQIGFQFTPKLLRIDFNKLNPINGVKRLFKLDKQAIELAKNIGKLTAIGVVVYFVLKPVVVGFEHFIGMDFADMLGEVHAVAFKMMAAIIVVVLLITIADYAYTYYSFHKQQRMTKQEVKDEYKQTEGDPLVKGKIRSMRIQKARQRMMAAVPKADVVVTNPTHYAVAMKYEPGADRAPVVLAKGVDFLAANIRKIAEEHGIPLVRNPPLARTLYDTVEIDHEIPAEHYRAVAEVITFVFKLKGRSLGGGR